MSNFDPSLLESIPAFRQQFEKGFLFTSTYSYMDQYGVAVLFWRVRLDHPQEGKFIRPVYQNLGDIYQLGEPEYIKGKTLKPLYNQHLLTQHSNAKVWIVEGEKCTDKLNAIFGTFGIFGEHVAITSGSASSGDKADLSLLKKRNIRIWPDNDSAGHTYAKIIQERLQIDATSVEMLDVQSMGLSLNEDCVDWFKKNTEITLEQILSLPLLMLPQSKNEVDIVRMSDLEMRPINWLWPDRIACGKLTLIAGNPGLGKSQITAMLAAHVTNGYPWPDFFDTPVNIGSVIFLSAEDDPADTILPRLIASEADTNKCHALQAIRVDDPSGKEHLRSFDLSQDLNRLRSVIDTVGDVRLIIIDPISAYLGKTKDNNNAEMRGLLAPLSALASDTGVAVVVVTHLNKSTTHDAIGRVIGSIGLIAAVRAGYIVSKDPVNPDIRHFVPIKNNIGNDKDGFFFTIRGVQVTDKIESSCIVWGDKVDAQKILYPEMNKPTQIDDVSEFLSQILANGPKPVVEIFSEGEGPGYKEKALRRAKEKLGIKHRKISMEGGWEWFFPNTSKYNNSFEDAEGTEDGSATG